MRRDCFFVSHFWLERENPDPDGEYLRDTQGNLKSQVWSYIWVDWTCMPQNPRSSPEEKYFNHCLRTMPAIIRNCSFSYFYPPFEPRLWILYEIAEYRLTCEEPTNNSYTPDIEEFQKHVDEMLAIGVKQTLVKYGYRCSYDRDRQYLMSWLELLVLLRRTIDVDFIRHIMDHVTWLNASIQFYDGGRVQVNRYAGTLVIGGETHSFTPFPQWVSKEALLNL